MTRTATYEILDTAETTIDGPAGVLVDTNACDCGTFRVNTPGGEVARTTCGRTSGHQFAPGHDARLKGLLIEAGTAGRVEEHRFYTTGKVRVLTHTVKSLKTGKTREVVEQIPLVEGRWEATNGPVAVASRYGFGRMVTQGIESRIAKEAARAEKAKGTQFSTLVNGEKVRWGTTAITTKSEVKAGRWWYPVNGATADGLLTYAAKNGETKAAPAGSETRAAK